MKTNKDLIHDIRSKISAINMGVDVISTNLSESKDISTELLDLLESRGASVYKDLVDLCKQLKSNTRDA